MTNNNNGVIRVALTNLGKYNEGVLAFEWVTLPATTDEVQTALDAIGIGEEYEEYFISDYEAPFHIGEYTSLDALNELAEAVSDIRGFDDIASGRHDVYDVINFANELSSEGHVIGAEEYVQDIVTDDMLDEMVQYEVESGGWQRVKFLLGGIDDINDDFYRINGYGNAENVTPDYLDAIVDDLMGELFTEYGL